MSGKMVRPHMGVKVGAEFVGAVKAVMVEKGVDRDKAIKHILWESRISSQLEVQYGTLHKQYCHSLDAHHESKMKAYNLSKLTKSLRRENRKLYMVIAILSVACISLAVL